MKNSRIQQMKRREILDAAIDVIADVGFDGARMDHFSKRSGLSRTNIHYYFRTREDIFIAVIQEAIDIWDGVWLGIDPKGDPRQELEKYISLKLEQTRKYPKLTRVYASEILRGAPLISDVIEKEMRPTFQAACGVLQTWMDEGKLRHVDPAHFFMMIFSSTQHYADYNAQVTLLLDKEQLSKHDFDIARETFFSVMLDGLVVS